MWQYRNTDEIYNDELYHYKYVRKYMGKGGKPVYIYQNTKSSKNKNITATTGQSVHGKYAQVEIGKAKDNWTYDDLKEKKIKIGKATFSYSNETGTHNFRVDVDKDNKKKKKEKRISKGKNVVDKLLISK